MRSPPGLPDDRTSRAVIRDEALRLFARRGPDGVTIRDIAAAAGVSPALVLRHYGSKDGLRGVVDDHAVRTLEAVLAELAPGPSGTGPFSPSALPALAEAVARHLPADSPLPAYLGRMLIDGGPAAAALFRRLHEASQRALAGLAEAGLACAGPDPPVRAAFLLSNDLAVLILRDRLTEVLGTDPLSPAGLRRWGSEVVSVYHDGLAAKPANPESP